MCANMLSATFALSEKALKGSKEIEPSYFSEMFVFKFIHAWPRDLGVKECPTKSPDN